MFKDLCGGTTTYGNPSAPTTINSNELTGMMLFFRHSLQGLVNPEQTSDAAYGFPEGHYNYQITKNGSNKLILKKNGKEYPMNELNLTLLNAVIGRENIAALNGQSRLTSGLPESVPRYSFMATYASGENIRVEQCPGSAPWLFSLAAFLDNYIANLEEAKPIASASPTGKTWSCSCGKKGLSSKFCDECGSPSPINADGSWNCGCGTKGLRSKFCGSCGQKTPIE